MFKMAAFLKTLRSAASFGGEVNISRLKLTARPFHATAVSSKQESGTEVEEEFRVYEIEGLVTKSDDTRTRRAQRIRTDQTPRFRSMPLDQDWTEVWPTAQTFKWSAVPFPVRQGFIDNTSENDGVVPSKYANLELMKIPNFLHLTPAHIKKHCAALKKFCTKWPEGLETDDRCRAYFPLEAVTSDYVFSAPSVRDDRARLASIRVRLSDLDLDYHAKDKFIRLVGPRYNPKTDMVIFESDKCPLKSQNLDYVKFLLTATYFESWKQESWEDLKELSDMEAYFWDINASRKSVVNLLKQIKSADERSENTQGKLDFLPSDLSDEDTICDLPELQRYKTAVEELFNEGETEENLNSYKEVVKKMLNLTSEAQSS